MLHADPWTIFHTSAYVSQEASAHIIAVGTNTAEVHLYDSLTLQRVSFIHVGLVGL